MSRSLNRSLNFTDVFALALGQIIGSGIMVLVGIGIEFTAYAIPFAFVLSALLSIIKQIPVAFMGSAMPATGGLYVYCKRVLQAILQKGRVWKKWCTPSKPCMRGSVTSVLKSHNNWL